MVMGWEHEGSKGSNAVSGDNTSLFTLQHFVNICF